MTAGGIDTLRRTLETYGPAAPEEERHRRRMLALLDTPAPFSREQYAPGHFTASGFVLSPDRGALLMVHHAKLHRWLQPGGHVEIGDATLIDAARREVREETGLGADWLSSSSTAPLDLDVHAIPAHDAAPAHEHFDVRFGFRAATVAVAHGVEATAVRWVPLSELASVWDAESAATRRLLDKLAV